MPRLNASQSQSYVLGSDRSGTDLPRFERPTLKQAKSAYSSTTSPRVPPKSSLSTGFFGGRKNGHNELPLTNSNGSPSRKNSENSKSKRNKLRAAVGAREIVGVLPDWSRTAPSPSNSFSHQSALSPNNSRNRTISQDAIYAQQAQHLHSPGLSTSMREQHSSHGDYDSDDEYLHVKQRRSSTNSSHHHSHHNHHDHHNEPSSNRALRQRKGYMEEYSSTPQGQRPSKPPNRNASGSSRFRQKSALLRFNSKLPNLQQWSLSQVFQGAIALLVIFLLYDGHHKANLIADRLKEFKSEEAMLFLHLHHIEQLSIRLHEALARLDVGDPQQKGGDPSNSKNKGEYLNDPRSSNGHAQPIDSALIQKQTQQLMQMEEELSHEVRTLQTRIQHSAVRSIVHEYGEGPVQVTWEVVLDGQVQKISILLWHDTPHAAWTWLEQITQKQWDGAKVHLENNRVLGIGSTYSEVSHDARLDFVERSQQRHEAWTVGLMEATQDGDVHTGLQVFINLQDNTEFSKHNVCIGKVFDGFDVLHKMVEQTRQIRSIKGGQAEPITIQTARASHLTNRETKGLI